MTTGCIQNGQTWRLPPLILHPVTDPSAPSKLAESSRASLMLEGFLRNDGCTDEELERKLLDGRLQEIRMLYYLGKDLVRWIDQCRELADKDDCLHEAGVQRQSFAAMLIEDPPDSVRGKLRSWGVVNYKAVFSRALGLNAVFGRAPAREDLSDDFVRNYHRFCDVLYACQQQLCPFTPIQCGNFEFELYASGEYSKMLEQEWGADQARS